MIALSILPETQVLIQISILFYQAKGNVLATFIRKVRRTFQIGAQAFGNLPMAYCVKVLYQTLDFYIVDHYQAHSHGLEHVLLKKGIQTQINSYILNKIPY